LEGAPSLSIDVCSPDGGPFTRDFTNPFLPYRPGLQTVLEGPAGSRIGRVQITVLDETETVAGVTTQVVEEREWIDDVLLGGLPQLRRSGTRRIGLLTTARMLTTTATARLLATAAHGEQARTITSPGS
jgi:hypothetical protein